MSGPIPQNAGLRDLLMQHLKEDVDFMKVSLYFSTENDECFIRTLTLSGFNVDFTKTHDIMDYSLLLGISTLDPDAEQKLKARAQLEDEQESSGLVDREFRSVFQANGGGLRAWNADGSPKNEMYFFGIIDILQEFDIRKKMENM